MGFLSTQSNGINIVSAYKGFLLVPYNPLHQHGVDRLSSSRQRTEFMMAKRREEVKEDQSNAFLQKTVNFVNQPIGNTQLALGYPLMLAGAFATFPLATATLLSLFFSAWTYLGRQLHNSNDGVDDFDQDFENDSDDMPTISIDFLAFGFALLNASLFSPEGLVTDNNSFVSLISGSGFVVILISLLLGPSFLELEQLSAEEELMDLWDRQLENDDEDNHKKQS